MSDQSSHFDSVLGTAINLGIHSVNDKGGLHYPKVSALAREAKELGGVRSKKEEKLSEGREGSIMKFIIFVIKFNIAPNIEQKHQSKLRITNAFS